MKVIHSLPRGRRCKGQTAIVLDSGRFVHHTSIPQRLKSNIFNVTHTRYITCPLALRVPACFWDHCPDLLHPFLSGLKALHLWTVDNPARSPLWLLSYWYSSGHNLWWNFCCWDRILFFRSYHSSFRCSQCPVVLFSGLHELVHEMASCVN